ncbi:Iron-sulfur cluster regulator IscR [hydrothermal vent metagenome]|uniref:Iron-sulfur cluster regulator IscR n=1 Tax=hydrothermal vent metagenome TaxID=652676 RepID=A0A3B0U204_9ZZZZ
MKLASKGRYAAMAMVDLAAQSAAGTAIRSISLGEIAARQGLSLAYLEQLFNKLRRAGLVEATRGPGGGYRLAAPADTIRLSDVMFAVDEPVHTNACPDVTGQGCQGRGQCDCHDVWNALGAHILSFLGAVTLADIVAGRSHEFVAPGLGCKAIRADEEDRNTGRGANAGAGPARFAVRG